MRVGERSGTRSTGWEGQEVVGDHRRLADEIAEVETGPVTAALYWIEYQIAEIRRVYEEAGFRVITHGCRGLDYRDTDLRVLVRQLIDCDATAESLRTG